MNWTARYGATAPVPKSWLKKDEEDGESSTRSGGFAGGQVLSKHEQRADQLPAHTSLKGGKNAACFQACAFKPEARPAGMMLPSRQ
jgi:hypothetical protein